MIITLTTDFGSRDGYVGAMKGVLARRAPDARVIDLAHDVPRHDVAHGAWVLASAALEYPPGTIHIAVVDPGVGGSRAGVIASIGGHLFVGPDNGLFGLVAGAGVAGAWRIEAAAFRAERVSATFHGRDVFAPAAAALATGRAPSEAGTAHALPAARRGGAGAIVHIDLYGNLISDLTLDAGPRWARPAVGAMVWIAGRALPLVRTYEDVELGRLCAYVGSMGTVEIAVREGDAARVLGVSRGAEVTLS